MSRSRILQWLKKDPSIQDNYGYTGISNSQDEWEAEEGLAPKKPFIFKITIPFGKLSEWIKKGGKR